MHLTYRNHTIACRIDNRIEGVWGGLRKDCRGWCWQGCQLCLQSQGLTANFILILIKINWEAMKNLFTLITALFALYLCTEPTKPYCVDGYTEFRYIYEFESCKSEVEMYLHDVKEYQDCLKDEIYKISNEANNVVSDFNSQASQ